MNQIAWKVGGQQGEGIDSTGEIFAKGLNRQGYFLYSYRHFSSRIKGGHTNNKVNISVDPIQIIPEKVDILVAFDQETIDLNQHELHDESIVIADEQFNPSLLGFREDNLYILPLTEIAQKNGTKLMKNIAAIGATCASLNIHLKTFKNVIKELFHDKGESVIQSNLKTLHDGYKEMSSLLSIKKKSFELNKADGNERLFMIGNEAIALGALASGVRLMPAYPITPASDIMESLIMYLPRVGGAVIQTEDEIAAATMAIGSNYAGVRSLTASAGPGLSLMMEAIGLSGMTETPLVIVDTQRGGPSTGLPTKHEQSDLMATIFGTHGDIPKVVFSPSTIDEAFYDTIEAFNIADEYQCPVIILSDLQLSLAKQTVEPFDLSKVSIRRGKLIKSNLESRKLHDGYFNRFEVTDSGISSRTIPGVKNGYHHVTGLEHDEFGHPNETVENRQLQMDKRMKKLSNITSSFNYPIKVGSSNTNSEILIVGFGSTFGVIENTVKRLNKEGVNANYLHIRLLHPFPVEETLEYVNGAKKVVVVESNATGQLAQLIQMNVGGHSKISRVLKYNGNPFLSTELYSKLMEGYNHEHTNI